LTTSLATSRETVRKLQTSLRAKAKAEPAFRFYSLRDKIHRPDVLAEAYRHCRRHAGAPGVDGEGFEAIEARGLEAWLGTLREELRAGTYRPRPLLRVWIPKSDGGQRPLGIPCIRDRVAQAAALLVLGPIVEADLPPQQYGFRPGLGAKMAVRRAYFHITQRGRREVVDADLSDYFGSIPHGPLLRCLRRRIADGRGLALIRAWLRVAVVERTGRTERRTAQARKRRRGVPQGGVVSPLLANLYFRRFVLAWEKLGWQRRLDAHIVNYADDFVICCRPGTGEAAMRAMRHLMVRLGLAVNDRKTRLAVLPEERFDFLGYTIGRFHGKGGRPYLGTVPSKKAVRSLLRRVHDLTSSRWNTTTPEGRIAALNPLLRGWAAYFSQGPVARVYDLVRWYTERRLQRWLTRRSGRQGTGYRRYPKSYLYQALGLYELPRAYVDPPSAKARELEREPDAGNPHVRFDERRLETEPGRAGLRGRSESDAVTPPGG
jgi:RNA-directed DNA polymerase